MQKIRTGGWTLFALAVALTGCGNAPEVRAIHASADSPAVDVYVRGSSTPVFSSVGFTEATGRKDLTTGSFVFEVRAAGSPASSPPTLVTEPISLSENERVSLVVAGMLGSPDPAQQLRVLVVREDFGSDIAGAARIRVVNASPDAPPVSIDVGDDTTAEIVDVPRFDTSAPEGAVVPSGRTLQLAVLAAQNQARQTAFTTPSLDSNQRLLVITTGQVVGLPRADGLTLLVVDEKEGTLVQLRQNPTVFVLHASPDAPTVDVFSGPTKVVDAVSFGALEPTQVPPGSYTLDVFPHQTGGVRPADAPVVSVMTPDLVAGERYLAVASGYVEAGRTPGPQVALYLEQLQVDGGMGTLRVIHASPDAPPIDVGTAMSELQVLPGFAALAYLAASPEPGLPLTPATYPLGVAPTGTVNAVAVFNVAITAGLRAFAVAAGSFAPVAGDQPFQLLVVDTTVFPWKVASILPN